MSVTLGSKEAAQRGVLEANIHIERDDPATADRVQYLAEYLEEGDTLNISVGDYEIKTRVTSSGKHKIARQ